MLIPLFVLVNTSPNLPPASCMVIIRIEEVKMNLSHPAEMFFPGDVEGGVDHGKKSRM